jgi:hypothetical protein
MNVHLIDRIFLKKKLNKVFKKIYSIIITTEAALYFYIINFT